MSVSLTYHLESIGYTYRHKPAIQDGNSGLQQTPKSDSLDDNRSYEAQNGADEELNKRQLDRLNPTRKPVDYVNVPCPEKCAYNIIGPATPPRISAIVDNRAGDDSCK